MAKSANPGCRFPVFKASSLQEEHQRSLNLLDADSLIYDHTRMRRQNDGIPVSIQTDVISDIHNEHEGHQTMSTRRVRPDAIEHTQQT